MSDTPRPQQAIALYADYQDPNIPREEFNIRSRNKRSKNVETITVLNHGEQFIIQERDGLWGHTSHKLHSGPFRTVRWYPKLDNEDYSI